MIEVEREAISSKSPLMDDAAQRRKEANWSDQSSSELLYINKTKQTAWTSLTLELIPEIRKKRKISQT